MATKGIGGRPNDRGGVRTTTPKPKTNTTPKPKK